MSRADALRKEAAVEKITRFIRSLEPSPIWSTWYVGITGDPERRLYGEHRAPYAESIYVSVDSEATARSVEKFLIEHYGMDGSPGGGEHPWIVYAFKKLADTDPPA